MTMTNIEQEFFTLLGDDLLPPCEYAHNDFCRKAPAKWILFVSCMDCGFGGTRLAGTDCKDLFLNTADLIECPRCDAVAPPKDFLKRIEAM